MANHYWSDFMFGLIPKEEKFFVMFKDMTKNIISGAILLKQLIDDFDTQPMEVYHKIKDLEHAGDNQTHEMITMLNKSFITPFDREDIFSLTSALDDVLDLIDASAQHLVSYHINQVTPEAKELAFIILKSCQSLEKAINYLGNKKNYPLIKECCVEINSLENEADKVKHGVVSKLFGEEKDPIFIMKWKEIYEILELTTDKCEDVANILESLVLKDA